MADLSLPERVISAKRIRAVTIKLYPNSRQERNLLSTLHACRWVYNQALEHRIKAWRRRRESITYQQQQSLLTIWRKKISFLASVPMHAERDGLRRVDRGFRAFFRRLSAGENPGFPRFKGICQWKSFEVLQTNKFLRGGSRIYVPGIGLVRYRGLVEFSGTIRGVRVIKRARGWFAQLIIDETLQCVSASNRQPSGLSVGVDVGLSHIAALSSGEVIDNPRWYQSAQCRLRFLQRKARKRQKGSNRRHAAHGRIARFHERISDTRKDWLHKLSRRLVDQYDLIAVEELNVNGMVRSRFGKSILDAAWSEFAWKLEYKAEKAGVRFLRVDPRGTSQECSDCGRTVKKKLSERTHRCECGLVLDRDVNAARNILRRATAELTRGESTLAGPQCAAGAAR